MSRVLELEGYNVLQAVDGKEGLGLAKRECIALVLLDLKLPKIDGWSVLAKLKGDPAVSKIPVVLITASDVESQRDRALNMGATDYLTKPLGSAILCEIVTRILPRKR
jgi:DNA-binding response OmpR family regulator